ncbi:hypothetical protein F3Y22_tig00112293pilonHSYRG00241 [Hibiscus syriacus]|uniref:Tf2-1-like SH3-like domain-containing protein n=1 Tax=Hibiscus syriacus TaxID=106335 RepID=A0A6A2YBQ0_HIBSY|nr:hypothetical protein F3Y22_tig00112293pilonHSYRG00241 [Hibiscus syriacus]
MSSSTNVMETDCREHVVVELDCCVSFDVNAHSAPNMSFEGLKNMETAAFDVNAYSTANLCLDGQHGLKNMESDLFTVVNDRELDFTRTETWSFSPPHTSVATETRWTSVDSRRCNEHDGARAVENGTKLEEMSVDEKKVLGTQLGKTEVKGRVRPAQVSSPRGVEAAQENRITTLESRMATNQGYVKEILNILTGRKEDQNQSAEDQVQTPNSSNMSNKQPVKVTIINDKTRFTYKPDEPGIFKSKPEDLPAHLASFKNDNKMGESSAVRTQLMALEVDKRDLCHRFYDKDFADIVEEFTKLVQKGSVEEYQDKFEELQPHMLLQNPTLGSKTIPIAIQPLLNRYHSIFADPTNLPPTRNHGHAIPLKPEATPINLRPYRFPYNQKVEWEDQGQYMAMGITLIIPSWVQEVEDIYKEDRMENDWISILPVNPTANPRTPKPLPIPQQAWEIITMDFIKAADVAKLYLDTVYKLHGQPKMAISDRGKTFTSLFWRELMKQLGTKTLFNTAYHPETDEWWYNTTYHTALKLTQFEALYGYKPPTMVWQAETNVQYVSELMCSREDIRQLVKLQLEHASKRMKQHTYKKRTKRVFAVGDTVYLKLQPYRQTSLALRKNLKLATKYYGPYKITEKIGEVAYRLDLPDSSRLHPVFTCWCAGQTSMKPMIYEKTILFFEASSLSLILGDKDLFQWRVLLQLEEMSVDEKKELGKQLGKAEVKAESDLPKSPAREELKQPRSCGPITCKEKEDKN